MVTPAKITDYFPPSPKPDESDGRDDVKETTLEPKGNQGLTDSALDLNMNSLKTAI